MNEPNEKEVHHSKLRHEQAIRCLVNDMLDGAVYSVLWQKLTEDMYGLDYKYSKSMASKMIAEARKRMREDYQEVVPNMRELLTNMCLDIISDARESYDRMSALKAVDTVAKLTGAYQNEINVKAKVDNNITIDFGFDEEKN